MKDIFLLDLDETLLDFRRTERENFFRTLKKYNVEADEALFALFHKINASLWELLEQGKILRSRLTVQRFEMLFREAGIAMSDERAAEVARAFFDGYLSICYPFEGSLEFLKTLSALGRVYIVTNGGIHIQKKHIEMAGYAPYLAGVFISEEVGFDKPQPGYVRYVEEHIEGYTKERAVWVGDSLTSDYGCAKEAGGDFVLFACRGIPEGYQGRAVTSYAEFLDYLKTT